MNVLPGPGFGARPEGQLTASDIRAMWRTASVERGWSYPDDWWVPAVDAIAEAAADGDDLIEACRRLGAARAHAGVTMKEALDDIRALCHLLRSLRSHPYGGIARHELDILEAVCATAEGWAEGIDGSSGATATEDPLTRLVDTAYLSARLGEIYQAAEYSGHRPNFTHAFVVVSLVGPRAPETNETVQRPSGVSERWEQVRQITELADDVQRVFARGETIALVSPSTVVVLAVRSPELSSQITVLRQILENRHFGIAVDQPSVVGVWLEGLPETLRSARNLLGELRR